MRELAFLSIDTLPGRATLGDDETKKYPLRYAYRDTGRYLAPLCSFLSVPAYRRPCRRINLSRDARRRFRTHRRGCRAFDCQVSFLTPNP